MKTILFVDDNALLTRISCEILTRHGYRTLPAYSAEEALKVADGEAIDLVITDQCMGGMDGLHLAHELHRKWPQLPVILVTAYDAVSSEDVLKCLPKDALFPELLKELASAIAALPAVAQK